MKHNAAFPAAAALICLLFSSCFFPRFVDTGSAGMFVEPYRSDTSNAVISLERMGYPVYALVLYPDGHVLYYGENFVKETGLRESTIPVDSVRSLLDLADEIGYFNRAKDNNRQEAPVAWTSVKAHGKSRDIFHYLGSADTSRGLVRFELAIDRVMLADQWIREK